MRSKKEIMEIMDIFNQRDPNPRCELDYQNAYTLLVAVVLSAQATDKGVNKATKALFAVADTPQKMLALGIDKLKEYIKTIGLFNNKAKSIMALSKDLVDKYGGEVPHNLAIKVDRGNPFRTTAKLWKASPGSDAKLPMSS